MREVTVLFDGFFDREDLREVFVFDEDGTGSCAGMGFGVGDNQTDRLTCGVNFVDRKEEFCYCQ